MLQSFRDQIKGWVATVVIGLLIIPFALWGVNSYFQYGAGGEWVAEIDGEKITVAEYRGEVQQQLARYQAMLGAQYRPELYDTPRLRQQVLEGMVDRALVERRTRQAGYRVGDAQLAEEIRAMEFFKVDGKFDRQVMRDKLASVRMTVPGFEARIRRDMTLSQLPDAIRNSEFVLPDEAARGVALLEEQRTATWIALPAVTFLKQVEVSEADVEAHYQAQQARYMTEESVTLEYLTLTPETLPAEASSAPTDAELRDLYAQESARFNQPEQRRARHILVDDEASAKAILAKLQGGADFAALATAESKDAGSAANGGDLGLMRKGDNVGPFDEALFAMQPGELRGPVKTDFGFHVIQLEEVVAGTAKPFEAVAAELAAEWQQRHAAERYGKVAEQLADAAYSNPDSLQPAAELLGLKLARVAGVTRTGGAEIATEQAVRDAAFGPEVLVERRNSGVIEIGEQQVAVVRVVEHQPSVLRPLAEVREEVTAAVREAKASALAQAKAEAIAAELRAGVAPDVIAKREQLPTPMARSLKRNGRDAPPEVAKALFDAARPVDAPVVGITRLGEADRMVFRVEKVVPGDLAALDEAEQAARRDALGQRRAALAMYAYTDSLKREAAVKLQPEKTRQQQ